MSPSESEPYALKSALSLPPPLALRSHGLGPRRSRCSAGGVLSYPLVDRCSGNVSQMRKSTLLSLARTSMQVSRFRFISIAMIGVLMRIKSVVSKS